MTLDVLLRESVGFEERRCFFWGRRPALLFYGPKVLWPLCPRRGQCASLRLILLRLEESLSEKLQGQAPMHNASSSKTVFEKQRLKSPKLNRLIKQKMLLARIQTDLRNLRRGKHFASPSTSRGARMPNTC